MAETIAIQAAGYIGADDDRLMAFCAQTGFSPKDMAENLGDPQFLGGVLDYILQSDELVLGLAAVANLPPEAIPVVRHALPGA